MNLSLSLFLSFCVLLYSDRPSPLGSKVYTFMDPKLHQVVIDECKNHQVEGSWE